MRLFPAPSVPWLLMHELRLFFRGTARGNKLIVLIGATVLLAMTFFGGVPLALWLKHKALVPEPAISMIVDGGALVLFTLMLSQTLSMVTQAFYDRGDLDLLLSSPIAPSRVLVVRCIAMVVAASSFYLALASPFILPVAAVGHWPLLAAYGVLAALAMTATALGLLMAMGLFATIGPRRTKTVGQVLAAFVGAIVFLASQSANLFPGGGPGVAQWVKDHFDPSMFGPDSLLSWPLRAIFGEPLPFFVLFGAGFLFFAWVVQAMGARFAVNASIAAGSAARRVRDTRPVRGFRRGITRALIRKELRLIRRDPALLSQVLLRLLYYIPLAAVLMRNARVGSDVLLMGTAGAVVFFAGQIAGSLAWITISAEDAPDIIASAPVTLRRARRAKLLAAILPVIVCGAIPVAVLAWFRPLAGAATGIGILCASLSTGLVNLWYEKPQPRKNFRRRSGTSLVASLGDFFILVAWSGATSLAISHSPWALAVAVIPLAMLALLSIGRNQNGAEAEPQLAGAPGR